MKRDTVPEPLITTLMSCEKDTEIILKKLFVDFNEHSETLKRLLVISSPDCLTNKDSQVIKEKIKEMSISKLKREGYVKTVPNINQEEFDKVKSYLFITFDNFTPNATNPYFTNCTITLDVICHVDHWELDNCQSRPLKIVGYIDGLLKNTRLTGLGQLFFMGCSQVTYSEELSGYSLIYHAVHGVDDKLPFKED